MSDLEGFSSMLQASGKALSVIISTVPAAAAFEVPDALLDSAPVVLDVVYRPARTALLAQAMARGCLVVQGATMLHEQAQEQEHLWIQRRAPALEMEAALFQDLEKL